MLNAKDKEASEAIATIQMTNNQKTVVARAIDRSTTQANIKAIFNGLNKLQNY